MKLTVFNGSPRGGKSNTRVFLEHFLKGFEENTGNSYELFYLNHLNDIERHVQAFAEAEHMLIAHPLYTDAMPGMVKRFIEALEPFCGRESNPDLVFIVQSGFGEAAHSRYIERYHGKLAARLGCQYLGTIIKGQGEPVQTYPKMFSKVFEMFSQLGKSFGETGQLDELLVRKLASPEKFSLMMRLIYGLVWKTRMGTAYWDEQFKENGVYEQRFSKPYTE